MALKRIGILFLFFICTSYLSASDDWGRTGHRVIGEIAEKHLKNSTKRKIKKLLNSHSLAFTSTFADEIKSDRRYDEFFTWHYINMPLDSRYEDSKKNENGDLVTGIEYCKKVIADKNSTEDDKIFYLKLLVHLVGDLHQPMHVGLEEDRGGNDFNVQWFGTDTNLHRVWDSDMIDKYQMSYLELARDADVLSKDDIKRIQSGSVIDWVNDVHKLTNDVYAFTVKGDNLRYSYSYKYFTTLRKQLQIGGIRLAKILNDLF